MSTTRRWVPWLSIAVWAIGGALFNLTRMSAVAHARTDVTTHGFCVPSELLTITRRTYAAGVCTIEIVDDGWRPLRVDVRMKAPPVLDASASPSASPSATTAAAVVTAPVVMGRFSVNDGTPQQLAIEAGAGERTYSIEVPPRARTATTAVVRIEASETPSGRAPPVDVGAIEVVRVQTTSGRAKAAAVGALVGLIVWWLIVPPLKSALTFTPRPPLPLPLEERRAPGRGIGGDAASSGEGGPSGDAAPFGEGGLLGDAASSDEGGPSGDAAPSGEGGPSGDAAPFGEGGPSAGDAAPFGEGGPSGDAAPSGEGGLLGDAASFGEGGPLRDARSSLEDGPLRRPRSSSLPRRRGFVLVWLGLSLYFSLWALVRPPYQTPDEVQHHLRATAVVRHPWLAEGDAWTLDPRFTNPLALWTPAVLDKLFFDARQRLRLQEISAIRDVAWPAADARPAPETYRRAIGSYPTLYYLALFGLAEPATEVLGLTPYQSTFAYRLASVVLASLLWAAVHHTLRRSGPAGDATRDLATPLVLFLVSNPMVAFMSSGINPDAVNVPLATLAILLLWRVLTVGDSVWLAVLALIATAWTKPSGLQVAVAFALAASALWMIGRLSFSRLRLAWAVVTVSGLLAWCGFYAWSPPRFVGGPPVPDTLATFLTTRWLALPETWVAYWGKLGWLEYALPEPWYVALLALTIVSVICVLARPYGSRLFAGFTALFLGGFLAVTLAGEFTYLPTAGYFLQGRHLLPASIGLAALMLHRIRAVRVGFLALLLAMNVLLLHETVLRYYTRGWSAVPATLPFRH